MNVPESFRPKKNSGEKLDKLLRDEKVFFDYDGLYQKLSTCLESFFQTRETGWNGIFYISDKFKESRYTVVRDIIYNIMNNLRTKFSYDKWELKNYYRPLDANDSLYNDLVWRGYYKPVIFMIYTSKKETKELTKDTRKKAMLGHKAMVITI